MNPFLKLLNIGVNPSLEIVAKRQLTTVNLIAMVGAAILFLEGIFNFSNDSSVIRVLELLTALVLLVTLLLNAKHFYLAAKLLFFGISLIFLSVGFYCFGPESGLQFYFITFAALGFLVFRFRQWVLSITFVLVMLGVYYAVSYQYTEGSLHAIKDKASLEIDFEVNLALSGLSFILILFYYNYLISDTEKLYTNQKIIRQKNEALIESVIDAYSSGVWVIDRNYKLIIFNKRYAEFCAAAFNGFSVYKGCNILQPNLSGHVETDAALSYYNREWQPFYAKAFEGETSIQQFEILVQGMPVKLEVSFAPFDVMDYASGAIMYSKRI